ncbi:hypothetical protein [Rhodoplanes roseus]|uniref:hypothetical protein n=1 Tax=Rhodoplanes roseus TaxID=29409 RepID=UPI0011B4E7B3|nr:hypothetical protein [Rhodoplanes roseus]
MLENTDPDPTFEAIRHHRVAHATHQAFLSIAEEDPADPERRAALDRMRADAEAAAWTLVEVTPTTIFGVRALASYAIEFVEGGFTWPEGWGKQLRSVVLRAYGSESS